MKKPASDQPGLGENDWKQRYIAGCRARLTGVPIDEVTLAFLDAVDAVAAVLPGELELALLQNGLSQGNEPELRLAASSLPTQASVYDLLRRAVIERKEHVYIDLQGRQVKLLQVIGNEGIVEACHVDRFTFRIEMEGGRVETVGPYGGVFLSVEQLKELQIVCNVEEKTLWLRRV